MVVKRYRIRGRAYMNLSPLPLTHPNGIKYKTYVNIHYKKQNRIRNADIYFLESAVPASTIDADGNIEMFVLQTKFDLFLKHWQAMRRKYIEYDATTVASEGFSILGELN